MPELTIAFFLCLTGVLFGTVARVSASVLRRTRRPAFAAVPPAALPIACFRWPRRSPAWASTCSRWAFRLCVSRPGRRGRATCRRPIIGGQPSLAGGHPLGPGLLLRGDAHGPAGCGWYGSRGLALAAAFFCSFLVWALPEFWQALLAIAMIGLLVSLAAWGSFCRRRLRPATSSRQGRPGHDLPGRALIRSMFGKQVIGEWFDPGFYWKYNVDRQGREVVAHVMGRRLGRSLDST